MRRAGTRSNERYDIVIVGSGFGGSVSALRLAEKGYDVCVVEAGRRFADDEFARGAWQLNRLAFAPKLGLYGLYRVHLLRNVGVLGGAGVGGGSLNYGNTLYRPPTAFYADPQWQDITDWAAELAPHYDQAERMLGATTNPLDTYCDRVMRAVAEEMGVADTLRPTTVGVLFAGEGDRLAGESVADPYFGGAGPTRSACTGCGACMTGCRVGAKNTLPKNYLGLAERAGATVVERTTVKHIEPFGDRWLIEADRSSAWGPIGARRRTIIADDVIVAAGTYNTQRLLHRARDSGELPRLSAALGRLTRTNSESILCATRATYDSDQDTSSGVAITSSFHPRPDTHIEPVRFGPGFNGIGGLFVPLTEGGGDKPRWRRLIARVRAEPGSGRQMMSYRDRAGRSIIVLVMQNLNNSLTTYVRRRGPLRYVTSRQGVGEPNPTWIPVGNEVAERAAAQMSGHAGGSSTDLFGATLTAHYLGGCPISADPDRGVIDAYHRVWGYPTLHIVDGSAISANLGVNPSLTITAQAERAMSLWPNKGERDERPTQGAGYRRLVPVAPRHAVVPATAPAALGTPRVRSTSA